MKFGSVKFFKRLIVLLFIVVILLPIVLAVMFGFLYARQKQMSEDLAAVTWALANGTPIEDVQLPAGMPQFTQAPANSPTPAYTAPASFEYQTLYPDLYAERPAMEMTEDKLCYLTFDDGPSPVTWDVLETLDAYDVKATFFVTGENSQQNTDALKAAAEAGHTIGVHTWSHEYDEIYASVDAFLADFEKMFTFVKDATGAAPTIFRFPGGSINVHNQAVYTEIVAEMTRRGFVFFDWNAAASDAVSGGISSQQVVNNVLSSAAGRERAIVLMHDREDNASTAAALPAIIEGLQAQGYAFAPLTSAVQPIAFYYTE